MVMKTYEVNYVVKKDAKRHREEVTTTSSNHAKDIVESRYDDDEIRIDGVKEV